MNPKGKSKYWRKNKSITRNSKGITLVALVVTIIVLIILAGVSINLVLGDNGIITKAQEASRKQEKATEKEQLILETYAAYGKEAVFNEDKFTLAITELGYTFEKETGKITTPKGNVFYVDEYGNIEEELPFDWSTVNLEDIDIATEYDDGNGFIINFTRDGKVILKQNYDEVILTIDATNIGNRNDDGNLVTPFNFGGNIFNAIIKMNTNKTDLDVELEGAGTSIFAKAEYDNINVYSNKAVLKKLGQKNNTGNYTGTWTVIGEENGKTKLVSTRNITTYTLGYGDPKAKVAVPVANENSPTSAEKLERSIWSYKNVLSTLNEVAKEKTGITSAKSVTIDDIYDIIGEENVNKGSLYGKLYNYYYDETNQRVYSKYQTGVDEETGEIIWSEPYKTSYESQTFVNDKGETVVVDLKDDEILLTHGDYSYILTDDQKTAIKSLANGDYWLASPCVGCFSNYAYFFVHCMYRGSIRYDDCLFNSVGQAYWYYPGVRAVVSF